MTCTSEFERISPGEHILHLYHSEAELTDRVSAFLAQGLALGEAAIVIATPPHRLAFERRLTENGLNVANLKGRGLYAPFDAAEALGLFMRDSMPEPLWFVSLFGPLIRAVAEKGTGVRAFGEMVALLWQEGNQDGALALEHLWNDLSDSYEFALFCAYPHGQFEAAEDGKRQAVCEAHSRVIAS